MSLIATELRARSVIWWKQHHVLVDGAQRVPGLPRFPGRLLNPLALLPEFNRAYGVPRNPDPQSGDRLSARIVLPRR